MMNGLFATAPGTVVESHVVRRQHEDGTYCYAPHICYEYHVAGRRYSSDSLFAFVPSAALLAPTRAEIGMLVARYPAGAAVTIFFDPNDPQQAFLERGTVPLRKLVAAILS